MLDILDASEFFATGLYDTGVYLPVAVSQVAAVPEPIVPWGWSAAVALAALARRWSSPVVRRRGEVRFRGFGPKLTGGPADSTVGE